MANFQIIAKTLFGLEDILKQEIIDLGGEEVETGNRFVTYKGDKELLYRSNLELRTALRILKPIINFKVQNEKELYKQVKAYPWHKLISPRQTISVDSTVYSKVFRHSKYTSLVVKDAIVDKIRETQNKRPDVDVNDPDFRIHLHISETKCSVSLDSSGDSLHKRGYRVQQNVAPINEVLAAGIILMSNWNRTEVFVDPMCGSGTFPIEAALIGMNKAPGLIRNEYGFMNWPDFDFELWDRLIKEAEAMILKDELKVYASDYSRKYIETTFENMKAAGVEDFVKAEPMNFFTLQPPEGGGKIIFNPPYGERIKVDEIEKFYSEIGDKLKKDCSGYDVWIVSSAKDSMKKVGLRPSQKTTLYNGPLEVKLQKYEMYRGSKKASKQTDQ